MKWLPWVGLFLAMAGVVSYLLMLFVIRRFTYKTWAFHAIVGAGVILGAAGWLAGGSGAVALAAGATGLLWSVATWNELAIRGSDRLRLRPGDRLPQFSLLTTTGEEVTDQDVVANGPALLVLYRGWWCPSHKAQLDELVAAHQRLAAAGLSVYAASVDGPDESRPVQDRVGASITVLCGLPVSLLEEIGVRDARGAPWYDRLLFGAKKQEIPMPTAIVTDAGGQVVFAARSTRIDARVAPDQILATLTRN